MRIIICILLLTLGISNFWSQSLDEVRINYSKAISDKELCKNLISRLEKNKDVSTTYLAYLGSLQAVWAHHTFNPINKLNTFNKGKSNIENAISKDPNNIELRFIRLSIQKNIPAFLGYQSNIKSDTEFIKKNINKIESKILLSNIQTLLDQ